jgi:hypothetical protein
MKIEIGTSKFIGFGISFSYYSFIIWLPFLDIKFLFYKLPKQG